MGKSQLFLLLSVVVCVVISRVESVPVKDSIAESENLQKCEKLCGFCGCKGFYCGDECLCECNSLTEGEGACVETMKSNCKKLELPFEVLIQGPNVNRMVRSLLYADPNEQTCDKSSETNQKKRSTIRIYKPEAIEQHDEILLAPAPYQPDDKETLVEDSPIQIVVGEKLDPVVTSMIDDNVDKEIYQQNLDDKQCHVELSQESKHDKLSLSEDDVDRTNVKRHIIDVNQEIGELEAIKDSENSLLYKRDTEGEEKVEDKAEDKKKDEEVGNAQEDVKVEEGGKDETVAATEPATTPATPHFLPRLRDAFKNINEHIPTSEEIHKAWDSVRNDINTNINKAITDAEKRADELKKRMAHTPTPAPAPAPTPAPPLFFNPFLKSENEAEDAAPHIPGIHTDIARNIAALRANNRLIQEVTRAEVREIIANMNRNRWLTPNSDVGSKLEEEEKKEETEEKAQE